MEEVDENDELDEDFEEESEEDEEIEALEEIVDNSSKVYKKTTRGISPTLEITQETQEPETEFRNTPQNRRENTENGLPSSNYDLSFNYTSTNYQSSNYAETSVYPKTISSQEPVNPSLSLNQGLSQQNSPQNFMMQNLSKMQRDSSGYPKENEVKKYEPLSGTRRDRRRY